MIYRIKPPKTFFQVFHLRKKVPLTFRTEDPQQAVVDFRNKVLQGFKNPNNIAVVSFKDNELLYSNFRRPRTYAVISNTLS